MIYKIRSNILDSERIYWFHNGCSFLFFFCVQVGILLNEYNQCDDNISVVRDSIFCNTILFVDYTAEQ